MCHQLKIVVVCFFSFFICTKSLGIGQQKMEGLKAEGMESQNQLPQSKHQGKGTTFLKTCFNGINALSGISLPLGKYALDTIGQLRKR
jgi:hypothetical protein